MMRICSETSVDIGDNSRLTGCIRTGALSNPFVQHAHCGQGQQYEMRAARPSTAPGLRSAGPVMMAAYLKQQASGRRIQQRHGRQARDGRESRQSRGRGADLRGAVRLTADDQQRLRQAPSTRRSALGTRASRRLRCTMPAAPALAALSATRRV